MFPSQLKHSHSASFSRNIDMTELLPTRRRLDYQRKVLIVSPIPPIGYWPMAEPSGGVALDASGNMRHGAYTSATLGQPGRGDGRTSVLFNGTSSTNNAYSASLAGAFNGAEGSLCGWFKVSGAGVWTDATTRRLAYFFVDSSNRVSILRTATNNQLSAFYLAGGTNKSVNFTASSLDWFHVAITWSKSADQVKVYLNGIQQGATQTGLGTWAGALASSTVRFGSATGGEFWSGFGQDGEARDYALSPGQIAELAAVQEFAP